MRTFLIMIITVAMVVTCSNVQALRDEYSSKPSYLESLVGNAINGTLTMEVLEGRK